MKGTKFGRNFFNSTRGRILDLLRVGVGTVDELSRGLELTDNAVRAHLATLERDGLVEQRGLQRGLRKPHFAYRLTDEAERLFPKAYHTLLNQLLVVLKLRLKPKELQSILREVASALAAGQNTSRSNESAERRAQRAVAVLEELGGASRIEKEDDKLLIRSNSGCPFSEIVSEHPEICRLAEVLLSEITKSEVREYCERGKSPQCAFEIMASK
ncbi:MAG: ArsR family transcriptional regulator [Acidobacteria bacterium]|nr:ArsR family transcriptional regulator [Acidobacteriota bacterium]